MTILKIHHTFRLSWINLRAESPGRFNIMPTNTHFKTVRKRKNGARCRLRLSCLVFENHQRFDITLFLITRESSPRKQAPP